MVKICCTLCGNTSSSDVSSKKASTIKINGCPVQMCCECEDEILKKTAKRKDIVIKLGDGGEVDNVRWIDPKFEVWLVDTFGHVLMSDDVEMITEKAGGY